MSAPDRRAQDGIDHLQTAAKEVIAAARAFLEVAEDLIDDPDRMAEAAGTVSDLVRRAGRTAGSPSEWSAAWVGVFGSGADPDDAVGRVGFDHDDDPANDDPANDDRSNDDRANDDRASYDGADLVDGPGGAQTDESEVVSLPGPDAKRDTSAEATNEPTDLASRRRSARARVRRIAVD